MEYVYMVMYSKLYVCLTHKSPPHQRDETKKYFVSK